MNKLEKEINRIHKILIDGHIQEFRGDPRNENEVYDLLEKLGGIFAYADNYDFRSTWNGAEIIINHLSKMIKEERKRKEERKNKSNKFWYYKGHQPVDSRLDILDPPKGV